MQDDQRIQRLREFATGERGPYDGIADDMAALLTGYGALLETCRGWNKNYTALSETHAKALGLLGRLRGHISNGHLDAEVATLLHGNADEEQRHIESLQPGERERARTAELPTVAEATGLRGPALALAEQLHREGHTNLKAR
jgi:hypothetical protein